MLFYVAAKRIYINHRFDIRFFLMHTNMSALSIVITGNQVKLSAVLVLFVLANI